ncbi:iron-sulfur cluster assembly protein [Pichia kluyveri]|uniref:Iron-sulfur cluster assembly protein n=1 Tax=Pichia kluyveri TaxID=36015 RepID=A0AAV5R1K6_PICKL|nr:iron-sulfur cluster assembly protein [Pichia kluyveri]
MSDEPINANPQVKDVSQLPTRLGGSSNEDNAFPHISYNNKLNNTIRNYLFEEEEEEEENTIDVEQKIDEYDEPIDAQEIYDLISSISDPEHPLTLGQLSVVNLSDIHVKHPDLNKGYVGSVNVKITPTITHCSLATLIGLGIRVRLDRSVNKSYRIGIYVKEGTHQSENQVNKQLNDKERVCAACENPQLVKVVGRMLDTCTI